ncbi:hypothetical protein [Lutibacter sp.]
MITKENTQINQLEKIVFLELTNKQFSKLPNSVYYETYENLKQKEKDLIYPEISNEIHQIWTCINTKKLNDSENLRVKSINEYNDLIHPVSEIVLKVSTDYNITLKNELSEKFLKAIRETLGQGFLERFLKNIE